MRKFERGERVIFRDFDGEVCSGTVINFDPRNRPPWQTLEPDDPEVSVLLDGAGEPATFTKEEFLMLTVIKSKDHFIESALPFVRSESWKSTLLVQICDGYTVMLSHLDQDIEQKKCFLKEVLDFAQTLELEIEQIEESK